MQPRETDSHRRHRREFWLQVVLPVALGALLVGAAGVLAAGGGQVAHLADLSLIWLLLPCVALGWIPLALILAAVVGLHRLMTYLPAPIQQVQDAVARTVVHIRRVADRVAAPLITMNAKAAALRRVFQRLRRG